MYLYMYVYEYIYSKCQEPTARSFVICISRVQGGLVASHNQSVRLTRAIKLMNVPINERLSIRFCKTAFIKGDYLLHIDMKYGAVGMCL